MSSNKTLRENMELVLVAGQEEMARIKEDYEQNPDEAKIEEYYELKDALEAVGAWFQRLVNVLQ